MSEPKRRHVISWTTGEPIDIDELARAIRDLSDGTIHIREIYTGIDQTGIEITDAKPEEQP